MFTVYTRYYHEEYLQYKNQLGDLCLFMGGVFDSPEQALEAIRADSHLIATVRTIYNFHPKSVLEFRGDGIVEQVLASEILEVT